MIDKNRYKRVLESFNYPDTITLQNIPKEEFREAVSCMIYMGYQLDRSISERNEYVFIKSESLQRIAKMAFGNEIFNRRNSFYK